MEKTDWGEKIKEIKYKPFLTKPILYTFVKTKDCKTPIRVEILCEDKEIIDQVISEIRNIIKL